MEIKVVENQRKCIQCKNVKSTKDFHKDRTRYKGGLQYRCKECTQKMNKERKLKFKSEGLCPRCGKNKPIIGKMSCKECLEKVREPNRLKYYETKHLTITRYLWNKAKYRAKMFNLEFSIEVSDVVIPEFCPVLSIPIIQGTDNSPSIDRIDPKRGYTKDNIAVISIRANMGKSNLDADEHRKIADWIDGITY
jgi:hypothetical protein